MKAGSKAKTAQEALPVVGEVLFATDFSPSSAVAGRLALGYARLLSARLHVLHVVCPRTEAGASQQLAQLAATLSTEVPVVAALERGSPAERIVRYARDHGVGLIVLSTHGRTGFTRALLGSVAERVVRTASCPVLTASEGCVAPPSAEAPMGRPRPEPPPGPRPCLVCATPSEDLICEGCRARIRPEALGHKVKEQRTGTS